MSRDAGLDTKDPGQLVETGRVVSSEGQPLRCATCRAWASLEIAGRSEWTASCAQERRARVITNHIGVGLAREGRHSNHTGGLLLFASMDALDRTGRSAMHYSEAKTQ